MLSYTQKGQITLHEFLLLDVVPFLKIINAWTCFSLHLYT